MKPHSVTLDDVAREAGVSYQTVSRVLNHAPRVAEKTRQRVEAAMRKLNYVPNRVAQQLAGKQTRLIGLLSADLALLAPGQIASAIQHQCRTFGYPLVMTMPATHDFAAAEDALRELQSQRVSAFLINIPLTPAEAESLMNRVAPAPCLFLDVPQPAGVPICAYSNAAGARAGVEQLIKRGCRRVALVNGPLSSGAARERRDCWQLALAEQGLVAVAEAAGEWDAPSGYLAAKQLLHQQPDALLMANDQMALGALRALHEQQIAVPQQVAVVGYDDTHESAWFQPSLTTIRQDFSLLGKQSVDWLAARLQGEDLPPPPLLQPVLVARESA